MARPPDYHTLYDVAILLLRANNVKIDELHMSECARKIGCNKRTLYNHIQRIKRDIYV